MANETCESSDELFSLSLEVQRGFMYEHRLREAKIPPVLEHATLENFETPTDAHKAMLNFAKQYLNSYGKPLSRFPRSLLFYGPIGRGKSHLAVGILKALIKKDFDCLFLSVPQWLNRIKASWKAEGGEERESDITLTAQDVEVLSLDELGANADYPWQQDRIHDLLCARYDHMRATIITTNLAWGRDPEKPEEPSEFEQRCGERIVSRIYHAYHRFGPGPDEDWRKK